MRFVIVTGMSGAGKSTALKMLEDMGYFCVDNLPVPLIPKLAELLTVSGSEVQKAALGVDIRSGQSFGELERMLEELDAMSMKYEILYLESSDDVLVKRYKETRRFHPLSGSSGRVDEGIKRERERLGFLKKRADYLVDHARKQNCFILGVLGNNLLKRHLPEWALKRGKLSETFKIHGHPAVLPDFEDWRRYVATTVRHFKGRIFYWEILNEANLTTTPEDYVKLLKIAFEECRKIDPSIKVVAPNVTGDHGGEMGVFLEPVADGDRFDPAYHRLVPSGVAALEHRTLLPL